MILRRFMQHVKEQNWFAVALDVIVVIVGIFLGLQVQAAYEEQSERKQERVYLERLHEELVDIEKSSAEFIEIHNLYSGLLAEFSEELTKKDGRIELNDTHCLAVALSHIYPPIISLVPTMAELISSGRLSIFSDQELRTIIARYLITEENGKMSINNVLADKLDLSRKYPALIELDYGVNDGSLRNIANATCDFSSMRENKSFKNDLIGNLRRLIGFSQSQFNLNALINETHARVDILLDVSH